MTEQTKQLSYLDHLNSFWYRKRAGEIDLSTSEVVLYLALLFISNRKSRNHFRTEFQFSASVSDLKKESGLSEPTILNARKKLKEQNLIDFVSGSGGSVVALYTIKHLDKFYIKKETQPPKKLSGRNNNQPPKSFSGTTQKVKWLTTQKVLPNKDIDKEYMYKEENTHTFSLNQLPEESHETVSNYLKHIEEMNGSLTDTQINAHIKNILDGINDYGLETAIEIINKATGMPWNWIDFKTLANDSRQKKTPAISPKYIH